MSLIQILYELQEKNAILHIENNELVVYSNPPLPEYLILASTRYRQALMDIIRAQEVIHAA